MTERFNFEQKKREDINLLKETWLEALEHDEFKPGYPDWHGVNVLHLEKKPGVQPSVTWCNFAFDYVAKKLGYDMSMLYLQTPEYKRCIEWSSPITMFDNAIKLSRGNFAVTGVREINKAAAVAYANKGVLVCVLTREYVGHVAAVWPTETDSCMIVGAGSQEVYGIKTYNQVYNNDKWKLNPRFFLLRRVE